MDNHILVVEDDAAIREGVRILLEGEGYIVQEAEDGYQCLKKVSDDIDLVILDIMMPGMDGPEVFRRMQEDERTQGIPVFFMTAVTDRDRVLECMEMNPEEYLVKPVSSSKLLKKLSDLFEKES